MATPLTPDEERLIRGDVELGYDTEACDVDRLFATLDAARAAGASLAKIVDELREEIRKRDAAAIGYTDMVSEQMREMTNRAARYEREAKAWRALHESDYGEDWNSCWNEVSAARAANEEAERVESA